MSPPKIIVLKFGSSVLRTSDDPPRVVHEIYRWLREGWRVIAVVSALEGETDRLLAEANGWDRHPDPSATALLASTGELKSAALVGLALGRAGVDSQVLDVAAIGLRTSGRHVWNTRPARLNLAKVRRLLARFPVLVLPGFLGRDRLGRTTLLGRGGSDCSALFLAKELGARCRLVKDVDGLYEWDPQRPGPSPRRFCQLSWSEALRLDEGIVQPKAIEFARDHQLSFEVGRLFQADATEVGRRPIAFQSRPAQPQPLRLVLLGLGNVGRGVYEGCRRNPESFQLVGVAVRDKSRASGIPAELVVDDLATALQLPCDVLLELIGDFEPAVRSIRRSLQRGIAVVTANKRVVAECGPSLVALAREHGTSIAWSAAVGGSTPILEKLSDLPLDDQDLSIQAVLNGTTNYVLDRWQAGLSLASALAEARSAGFAEADASRDLNGADAADKLVLIHRQLTGSWVPPAAIPRESLDESWLAKCTDSPRPCVRQIAIWDRREGQHSLSVRLQTLDRRHPLARLRLQENGAIVRRRGKRVFLRGKGAGRWPTTEAVLADLFDLARTRIDRQLGAEAPAALRENPQTLFQEVVR